MKQDFHGSFRVNVTWFFAFFSGLLAWTESCSFSYGWKGYSCTWLKPCILHFICLWPRTFSTISSEFAYLLSVVEFNNSQKLFVTWAITVCISNLLICFRIQQKIHETHKIWHPSEQNYLFVHFNQRQQYFQGVCKNFSKSLPWGWYGYFWNQTIGRRDENPHRQ